MKSVLNYLRKRYNEECNKLLGAIGFWRCGPNHWRIINDVAQAVGFKKSTGGDNYRVLFAVYPLCFHVPKSYDTEPAGRNIISEFFTGTNVPWCYEKDSEASVDKCINETIAAISEYLVPFFERATNCKDAYDAVCDFERLKAKLFKSDFDHSLSHKNNVFMIDIRKVYMALKFEDYSLALEHLEWISRSYMKVDPDFVERVKNRDMEHINNLIETNEADSRKFLGELYELSKKEK